MKAIGIKKLIQCGTCIYFRINPAMAKNKELHKQGGTCHKRPPSGKDGFPKVSGEDFCGEGVEGACPFEKAAQEPAVSGYASAYR